MKTHALIGAVVLIAAVASAQVPSFDSISHTVEVGTVAVALNPPEATIPKSMLATPQNIAALATVKTICVMPYDGWKAKSVIDALPSFDLIREGLASDKKLREQRNEASEELERVGFQTKDCLSGGATPPDAEIIFTNVAGGFGNTDLPTFYWVLYANTKLAITVHGEQELLGLARPAAISVPLNMATMAEQVTACVKVARSKAR